jgi:glycosyltransferase involved in cell wall biosynthesis
MARRRGRSSAARRRVGVALARAQDVVAGGVDAEQIQPIAINGRAAVRAEIGGVERFAREMAMRLPALRPDRYRVIRPPLTLAHRAGHAWEQMVLPLRARQCRLIYSPANLAPILEQRNVLVLHDAAALRHPEAYSAQYVAYQRALLPRLARRARLVLTVSEFSRGELVDLLDISPEAVTVIPEGVDERFTTGLDAAPAIARYGLERPYVLVVGTVSARKNLHALAGAGTALAAHGVDLVVAGSDRGYLRGSGSAIRRLGYVDEQLLPALYSGARTVVLPSTYEGFGLPCLEAMACGVPVVAAARGALPETCGDAALLVDPDRPDELAQATLAAACDDQTRVRAISSGIARAARFPWSATAALTDRALERLLERT